MLRQTSPSRSEGPSVTGFFDPRTFSIQYVASDPATRQCVLIDPVLDYDEKSGRMKTASADALLDHVRAENLTVAWILDTHPHADHLTAMHYLKEQTGAATAIGAEVVRMQELWRDLYNLPPSFRTDGSQWDRLLRDGDTFPIGNLTARVILSPGHTLASVTYLIGDAVFVHDTLFMPDSGTARADFPGGDPKVLWHSMQAILALPGDTRVFTGHDYQPHGRAPLWESTVSEQSRTNVHLAEAATAEGFAVIRSSRDRTLPMPKLILHALQINIAAGTLPAPEANGRRYFRIPLGALGDAAWD